MATGGNPTKECVYEGRCRSCGHDNHPCCSECAHPLSPHLGAQVHVENAGDVNIADLAITVNQKHSDASGKRDTVKQFGTTPEGGVYIKTVKNLTIAQSHTTINVDLNSSVRIDVATDPEAVEAVADGVLILKTDWSDTTADEQQGNLSQNEGTTAVIEQQQNKTKERELIITKLINKKSKNFFFEVMGEIKNEELPQKVVKRLFSQFDLRLLGLTKRLEFLMDVDSDSLSDVMKQTQEVQDVLAELVPRHRRQEVTWETCSRGPVQCSDDQHAGTEAARDNTEEESAPDPMAATPPRVLESAPTSAPDPMTATPPPVLESTPTPAPDPMTATAPPVLESTPTPAPDPMTATPRRVFESTLTSADDTETPEITAIVNTRHGRLVMADRANSKVKVVDLTDPHTVTASLHLDVAPWRLALLSDGLVAVTTSAKTIYLLGVDNDVTLESQLQTDRVYWGVAGNSDGTLIVSCGIDGGRPARVDVITRGGDLVRTVADGSRLTGLEWPLFLCVADGHVWVSDNTAHTVHRVELTTGRVVDTLTHTDMQLPQQVSVDRAGNVYVASHFGYCVLVRSGSGEWRRLLQAPRDSQPGYDTPYGVCVTSRGVVVTWRKGLYDSVVIGYDLE